MEKSIEIKNLSKSFGKTSVLKNISFRSEGGEFIVLVGPSGCGKSTLLNLIAGLDEVTTGDIFINGKNVTELSPKERDIAMVFQSYALYPNMTVKENIGFGLKRTKTLSKEEIGNVVEDVASSLQISPLLARLPAQLSGGERQRVAMGRAISRKPKIYLFDEPLSNLDAKLRVEMRVEIKELHAKDQRTVVYVTHDQIEAMTLADKIVVLDKGKIQHEGTPSEVYRFPKNMFVASFIGSPAMNFIPITLKETPGGVDFSLEGAVGKAVTIKFPTSSNALKPYIGKEVILGLRPENIVEQGTIEDEKNISVTVPSEVRFLELTGPDSFLHTQLNGGMTLCRCNPMLKAQRNDIVDMSIKLDTLVFFDSATEALIDLR